MKIGRNAPCPCGSGKKYKRCCGDPLKLTTSPLGSQRLDESVLRELKSRGEQMVRAHQARERVRQQQQGFGKPVVSAVMSHGYRLVSVGSTVHWSKDWLVFSDFLLYFLKKTLNVEWGAREQERDSPHLLFRWLRQFKDFIAQQPVSHGKPPNPS